MLHYQHGWGETYVDLGIIRQRGQRLVQGRMHLGRRPFEEPATTFVHHQYRRCLYDAATTTVTRPEVRTSNEKSIPRENHSLLPILHQPANTVLRMAGRMQRLDRYLVTDLETLLVLGGSGHGFAIFAPNDGELEALEL